jgi:putative CocE/NonD family hydrolase
MATIRTEFPRAIREIENTFIPMPDGVKLAARIWLPLDAEQNPVPAILEYLPYRKNDGTAQGDAVRHPYWAAYGYACVRVDLRGSGDSDGILLDEYLKQEQDDALEVMKWLAAQPWCTGAVGMYGISWGGFNGLQVAARNPPELKAVISLCSTDDRYLDDCHYMGGCLLASDMLRWAAFMQAFNAQPPDPRFVGDRWREMWFERMEQSPPFVTAWMSHQRRDAFWKHGSICEDYSAITCAVYMVGGWADGYTNAIPRTLAGLPGPKKGLIGPWAHNRPERGVPGPAIGFLQECLRWWDYWLKGIETGIMDEPMLRSWIQDSLPPAPHYDYVPGRWVADPAWPSPHVAPRSLYLNEGGRLDETAAGEARAEIAGKLLAGHTAGVWCPYGRPGDMPADQAPDDGLALCFDTAPAADAIETLGYPGVTLALAADRRVAHVAVRLCDVAPSGSSLLVSWGLLNLTHRDSHEFPEPLEPGRRYTVTVRLNAMGHRLPAGHRWRVALSPAYWPHAWPAPEPVTLTVFTGEASRLDLPVRAPQPGDANLPDFLEPEISAPLPVAELRTTYRERTFQRDLIRRDARLIQTDHTDHGSVRFLGSDDLDYGSDGADLFEIVETDPLSASLRSNRTITIGRREWRIRIETTAKITGDAESFRITNTLDAYEGNARVFSKTWTDVVPRDLI